MRRVVWIGLALVVVAGVLLMVLPSVFAVQFGERGFKRAVEQQVGRNTAADLGPGLHVITVGTGSPLPDPARAGPMTVIVADGRVFVFDAGGGSVRKFGEFGLPAGAVEAVFLTHFHSDHIDSLGELMLQRWANGGHAEPLPVIGPSGVEQVVRGFNLAYAQDSEYRVAHHGEDIMPPSGFGGEPIAFELLESGESQTVYNVDGLRVVMFPVTHDPVFPAVGYRFEFGGHIVVLSGDTAFSERLIAEASGADLLVHEALNPDMVALISNQAGAVGLDRAAHIMADIPSYHATPAEAARVAKEAGVDMLILNHIVPAVPDRRLAPYYLKGTKEVWDGDIVLAEDGDVFSMRATEERIRRSDLR